MRNLHVLAAVLPVVLGCAGPTPGQPASAPTHALTPSPGAMDSATIERLCQQPDSVRAGRAPCLFKEPPPHSYVPPLGFVPDSATAARIAEAVWIPIYGEANIRRQRPYAAQLRDDVWTVYGYLPPERLGGVALAEISKRDGRILRVSHGR